MKIQDALEEVIKASGIPSSQIGIAFTKATKGLFVVAEIASAEPLGENGVYGLGNQRRFDTTVNLTITFPAKEGNPKIYGKVTDSAENIAANISAYQISAADVIDMYVNSISFDTTDETGQEQIVSAVVSVVVQHNAA